MFSSNVEHALAKEGRAQWSSWKKQVAGVLPAFLTSAIDKADVPLVVLFQRGNYLCKRCKGDLYHENTSRIWRLDLESNITCL